MGNTLDDNYIVNVNQLFLNKKINTFSSSNIQVARPFLYLIY